MKIALTNTKSFDSKGVLNDYPVLKDITTADKDKVVIELETIKDILNLMKLVNQKEVVISNFDEAEIEIYDAYRE